MIVFANIIERKAVDQKLIHKMLKFRGNKNINIDYFLEKFSKNLNLEFMPIIKKKANSYSETKNISEKINGEDSNNNNDNQILKNNSSIFEGMSTINFESIPKPANIGTKEIKAAILSDVPSKVSGSQLEKGTSPTLNVKPNVHNTHPLLKNGEEIEPSFITEYITSKFNDPTAK